MARTPVAHRSSAPENENVVAVGGGSDFASAASDNVRVGNSSERGSTMSIAELVGLGVLTGLGAGLLAGLVGIGGGVVIVPAVYYGLTSTGVSPNDAAHVAVATSLASIVPASVVSFARHLKSGHADLEFLKEWGPGIVLRGCRRANSGTASRWKGARDGFCRPLPYLRVQVCVSRSLRSGAGRSARWLFSTLCQHGDRCLFGAGWCWRWHSDERCHDAVGAAHAQKCRARCGNRHRRQHPGHGGGSDGDTLLQPDPARQHRSRNLGLHRASAGRSCLAGREYGGARERASAEPGFFNCAHSDGGGDVTLRHLALTCAGQSFYRLTARSGRHCGVCFVDAGHFTKEPVSRFSCHRNVATLVTPSFSFGRVGAFDCQAFPGRFAPGESGACGKSH